MVISISTSALNDPSGNFLLRPGSLWALRSLQEMGTEISLLREGDALNQEQNKLLQQEGIHLQEGAADMQLSGEKNSLKLSLSGQTLFDAQNWSEMVHFIQYPPRKARRKRTTKETDITIEVNLDGSGESRISTGLNFFDHMLEQIARHGLIDLHIDCKGDLHVDEHHTVEDVAIALGECISEALGKKTGIERYGFVLAMDESKATVSLDLSGRSYLVFDGSFNREYVGDLPTEMVKHFFYSLAMNLKATLNIEFQGENDHHKIEACFKGFAKALKTALERNPRQLNQLPSSKGIL